MKPYGKKLQIKIDEVKIGAIQSDSITERGTIMRVGELCELFNDIDVGRDIYFKAWAVDVITDNGEKYYFISEDSEGICATL